MKKTILYLFFVLCLISFGNADLVCNKIQNPILSYNFDTHTSEGFIQFNYDVNARAMTFVNSDVRNADGLNWAVYSQNVSLTNYSYFEFEYSNPYAYLFIGITKYNETYSSSFSCNSEMPLIIFFNQLSSSISFVDGNCNILNSCSNSFNSLDDVKIFFNENQTIVYKNTIEICNYTFNYTTNPEFIEFKENTFNNLIMANYNTIDEIDDFIITSYYDFCNETIPPQNETQTNQTDVAQAINNLSTSLNKSIIILIAFILFLTSLLIIAKAKDVVMTMVNIVIDISLVFLFNSVGLVIFVYLSIILIVLNMVILLANL